MTDAVDQVIEARVAAAEARTDTKFAQVLGRLDTLNARLDVAPTKQTIWGAAVTIVLGVGAILLASLAFGSQMFGQGFSASTIADQAATKAVAAVAHKPPG